MFLISVNGPTGPDGATKVLSENNLTLPLRNTGSTALLRRRQPRRSDFYPIAAASLGGIKSLVGIVEQCLAADQARNGYLRSRKPKAEGDPYRACGGVDGFVSDTVAQPFRSYLQVQSVAPRNNDEKLFSSISAH